MNTSKGHSGIKKEAIIIPLDINSNANVWVLCRVTPVAPRGEA
ncbi:unnamed protein product [Schistosoma mattheei]|uniref:Uncharacterized protein n=1 Tax=Schistosoma mattheei TaxID=31246 RepID=A0A183Q7C2_9TREM|nr:unnamed protein product [Schistosoma mattheei]